MPPYFETIFYIFALIAIGYIAVASRYLKAETGDGLASFVYNVGVPLLLFKIILNAEFGKSEVLQIWAIYFGSAAITWTLSHLVVQKVFGRDTRAGVVAGLTHKMLTNFRALIESTNGAHESSAQNSRTHN